MRQETRNQYTTLLNSLLMNIDLEGVGIRRHLPRNDDAPKAIIKLTKSNKIDLLVTFGAFMAVLIAIEIFINITVYLREDVIHVRIVMATALMAIARKVIILDLEQIEPEYLWGIASVVFAISIGYWLVVKLPRFDLNLRHGKLVQQRDTVGLEENAKSIIAREDVATQES